MFFIKRMQPWKCQVLRVEGLAPKSSIVSLSIL